MQTQSISEVGGMSSPSTAVRVAKMMSYIKRESLASPKKRLSFKNRFSIKESPKRFSILKQQSLNIEDENSNLI